MTRDGTAKDFECAVHGPSQALWSRIAHDYLCQECVRERIWGDAVTTEIIRRCPERFEGMVPIRVVQDIERLEAKLALYQKLFMEGLSHTSYWSDNGALAAAHGPPGEVKDPAVQASLIGLADDVMMAAEDFLDNPCSGIELHKKICRYRDARGAR